MASAARKQERAVNVTEVMGIAAVLLAVQFWWEV